MNVIEELNKLTIVKMPETKKEEKNLIDALTQAQYNYNREDIGMSAEDLAIVFGKEKGAELEKNYVESFEQNYGRKPSEEDEISEDEWEHWDKEEAKKESWYD